MTNLRIQIMMRNGSIGWATQTPPPSRLLMSYLSPTRSVQRWSTSEQKEQKLMNKTLHQLGWLNTISNRPYQLVQDFLDQQYLISFRMPETDVLKSTYNYTPSPLVRE